MVCDRPLHILHVTAPAAFGGLEAVVLELADGIRSRGHRVTVSVATEGANVHPFVAALRERSLDLFLPPSGYWAEIRAIRDFAARERVDVLHSHGYRADLLTLLASRRPRRRRASTVHGFTFTGFKNRVYERVQRAALRAFDAVIPVSQPLRILLRRSGVPSGRLHCIPNGYRCAQAPKARGEARGRLGLPQEGVIIGWVGRMSREKGPDIALHALHGLERRDWIAAFLGDGPDRASLRTLADRLGIAANIRWLGVVPRAGGLLAAFDALLLSSRTEGTPVVLLEAMAAGVPVVATAVGGVPDLLGGGSAGWLAAPRDSDALSVALGEALAGGAAVEHRVATARERLATEYEPEAWIDRYEAVYRRLMD